MKQYNILGKIFNILIVVVLVLLYWSSDLLERDVKTLKNGVALVQNDLKELLKQTKLLEVQFKKNCENPQSQNPTSFFNPQTLQISSLESVLVGDPNFSNLLSEDVFVSEKIPELLGKNFFPGGTLHMGLVGRPENLHPFSGYVNVVRGYEMAVAKLAEAHVGKFERFSPELALKIEERPVKDESGDKEFWIYLSNEYFWQPLNPLAFPNNFVFSEEFLQKHPVTAHDFKFFFDVLRNPYISETGAMILCAHFDDIVDFRVIDDFTFVVRWRAHDILEDGEIVKKVKYTAFLDTLSLRPLPRFVYQKFANGEKIIIDDEDPDIYSKDSVWAEHFSAHWALNYIVSCGSCIFNGLQDDIIVFLRNPEFLGRHKCFFSKQVVHIKESVEALFQDFKAGKIDITLLPPNQGDQLENFMRSSAYANQVKKGAAICSLNGATRSYSYIGWNYNSLFFKDKKIRQAMNMAIDKNRLVEQVMNGAATVVTGPFSPASPSYNKEVEPWPYSKEEAVRLLEEEGWMDTDGDGIREKEINGVKVSFRFRFYYFIKSQLLKNIAEYVSMALKDIGIDCKLIGVDYADCNRIFEEKNFDAILMGWSMGQPPESLRAIWHSEVADKRGSGNAISFKNEEVDHLIDTLDYEYDKDKRREYYYKIHAILHEEAPYCFLFSRDRAFLYRSYLRNFFIPRDRQDLIPGAEDDTAFSSLMWMDQDND